MFLSSQPSCSALLRDDGALAEVPVVRLSQRHMHKVVLAYPRDDMPEATQYNPAGLKSIESFSGHGPFCYLVRNGE